MLRRRLSILFIFAALAASLGGCASVQKALGLKTDLDDKAVKKLEIDLVGTESICPGGQVPIIVTAVLDDGQRLKTEGAGQGKVSWDNYQVEAVGGHLVNGGLFTMSGDPRVSFNKGAKLVVRSKHHPNKTAEATVDPRYDCSYTANFSGRPGRDGENGRPGSNGRHGTDEQSSGSHAEPGGHGERGGDGDDGRDGEPGQDGDDVEVHVALAEADAEKPLLKVRVRSTSSDHTEIFLIDPSAGKLTILANGGRGGNGGDGGNGGSGGTGGTGKPAGNGGDGGHGGNGGNGAGGGDGGSIKLVVDPAAKTYLEAIVPENRGGPGGQPGSAGYGGSGGNTLSGGEQGRRGENGERGTRTGRPGRNGPEPVVVFESVAQVW